jgi:isopentenyl-diphosphate delta-isomerase
VGRFVYRAGDPASGQVEHEYDHVLMGRVDPSAELAPDETEVADLQWLTPDALRSRLAADPDAYAPWLSGVLAAWEEFAARGDRTQRSIG